MGNGCLSINNAAGQQYVFAGILSSSRFAELNEIISRIHAITWNSKNKKEAEIDLLDDMVPEAGLEPAQPLLATGF